jgi:hypothetical protein
MRIKVSSRRWAGWLLLAPLLLLDASQTAGAEPAASEGLRERIEWSYRQGDVAAIEAARRELLAGHGENGSFLAAYARFRQSLAAGNDRTAARTYVEDCIGELRQYVERHPADAEARALLGSCYGISTRYHRLQMASRGLEARRQIAAARELAPHNPWVVLQDGLADEAAPRFFGGDRKLAIAKLERAASLFQSAARAGSRAAVWGAAETELQLARMYRESGMRPQSTQ